MANKQLFKSTRKSNVPAHNTRNQAGGKAYRFEDAHILCQYAVTNTFGGTYYASARNQLDTLKSVIENVEPKIIAKAAVYSRQHGNMKDMPAYLLAVLAARGEVELLKQVWDQVINNPKMLYNFIQIIRSGVTGRRSFGTAVRRLIRNWFTSRTGDQIYRASIGASNPSMADVIKMIHPTPDSTEKSALYAYLLGAKLEEGDVLNRYSHDGDIQQQYHLTDCPQLVQDVEWFKYSNTNTLPALDYRALTNYNLTPAHWKQIARNMPWNALRMNLNVLQRNGVFEDAQLTRELAAKLGDADEVRKWNAFPYQLLTTYKNVGGVPSPIKNALQAAMEIATVNIPALTDGVAVCIDLSGSMGSAVTGYGGKPTETTCYDVAALIAASIARVNKDTEVIAWASTCKRVRFNAYDSIMSNAKLFRNQHVGYGTNASLAMELLNRENWQGKTIIYVSDNQSWISNNSWGGTGLAHEWESYSRRVPNAKLICIDIQANESTQAPERKNTLNVGGFSDAVFDIVGNFVHGDYDNFVDVVQSVRLGE